MLNARDLRVMRFLRRQAIDVDPVGSAKIAAAISFRNEIISLGQNQKRTHPFQAKYAKNPESIYLHAETNAICNALNHINKSDLERSTLYIRRVKKPTRDAKDFVDGLAKPCAGCMRAIIAFGIKKVVYSTDDSEQFEVLDRDAGAINISCY